MEQIGALYKHEKLERPPSMFVVHRFLASDRDLAPVAKVFNLNIRDDAMAWQTWRAVLPRQPKAPYLKYPAPGKAGKPSELVARAMEVFGWNRHTAQENINIIELAGQLDDFANRLGIELEDEDA